MGLVQLGKSDHVQMMERTDDPVKGSVSMSDRRYLQYAVDGDALES